MDWRDIVEKAVRRTTCLRRRSGLIGFALLAAYLAIFRNFSFSPLWAVAMMLGLLFISGLGVALRLDERFPHLDRFALGRRSASSGSAHLPSSTDWLEQKIRFSVGDIKLWHILLTPAEDGLICVPVLLVGVNAVSAVAAGIVFAFLHLERWTYLESMIKGFSWTFVCLLVLPHGVLTVAVAHMVIDLVALTLLR